MAILTTRELVFATVSTKGFKGFELHRAHGADVEAKEATANDGDGGDEIDVAKLLHHGGRVCVGVMSTQRRSEVGRGRCSMLVCNATAEDRGVVTGRVRAEGFMFRGQVLGKELRWWERHATSLCRRLVTPVQQTLPGATYAMKYIGYVDTYGLGMHMPAGDRRCPGSRPIINPTVSCESHVPAGMQGPPR